MKRAAIALLLLCSALASAQGSIAANEAKNHVGENVTVCGEAVSIHHATRSRGSPTFINLDKPYPNQVFTVVIWGSDRPKFGNPEQAYEGKRMCVTGTITLYQGRAETIAHEPSQVKTQ